ncbi:hypothetical protein [Schleiferia thermophila]|uniref:hypothetical protein n=1 Tax=Schleiferia thermophila TaxID=884107 RepID=UPI000F61D3AC|nr:hypothetical protein [Schleiferia thermophila]GCD79884.1 hypothetical protein JCM30197_11310 [Schleiferia thermophila]
MLEKESFLNWRFIKDLENKNSVFKNIELQSRLKKSFIKLKDVIIFVFFTLLFITVVSILNNQVINPLKTSVYDTYLKKFNIVTNKSLYLEGDSLIVMTDKISEDISIGYQGNFSLLNTNTIYLGFVNGQNNYITLNLGNYNKKIYFDVVKKPKIINSIVDVRFGENYNKKFKNEFIIDAFIDSKISIYLNLDNATEKGKQINFSLKKDTVINIVFSNDKITDSVQYYFKGSQPIAPSINYEEYDQGYKIYISDLYGLKRLEVNEEKRNLSGLGFSMILNSSNSGIFRVMAENILNQKTFIVLNNKTSVDYSYETSDSFDGNDINNNSMHDDIFEDLNNLIKTLDLFYNSTLIEKKVYLDIKEYLLKQMKIFNNSNDLKIKNDIKQDLKELNEIFKEISNKQLDTKNINNEEKKLNNNLNKFMNKRNSINTPNESDGDVLTAEDVINLENYLVNLNLISLNIDKNIYRNTSQLIRVSSLLSVIDSLNVLSNKNRKIGEILSLDILSIKNLAENKNSDILEVRYRINNLTVKIYNVLKNREVLNSMSGENKQNSNCSDSNGNSKKPGLSELLSDILSDGNSGNNDSEQENGENKNGKGNTSNSKDDGNTNDIKNENNNKGHNGNSLSLEEIEKQLINKIGNYDNQDSVFKRKIKWLDYSRTERINPDFDNKRKGNYVNTIETEPFKLTYDKPENLLIIKKQTLRKKKNVFY